MPYFVTLAMDSLADAMSSFTTTFNTVWSFVTGNWYFTALIAIPLGGLIVSIIIGVIRGAR